MSNCTGNVALDGYKRLSSADRMTGLRPQATEDGPVKPRPFWFIEE